MAEQEKKNVAIVLGGGITQDQLDAWKKEHGEVVIVKVTVDEEQGIVKTGYFKKPKRPVLANVVNMATENKVFEAREFLANNTFIGGDAEIKTNEDVAIAAQIQLWRSLNFLKAEAVKY